MKIIQAKQPRLRPVSVALLLPLLAGALLAGAERMDGPPAPIPAPGPQPAAASHPTPLAPGAFSSVATALRGKDLRRAWEIARIVETRDPAAAPHVPLVLGLAAYSLGDVEYAERLLSNSTAADSRLEEWRLYALGESAGALGHWGLAQTAFTRLLAEHPTSLLRRQALWRAATLAHQHQQSAFALELIALGRRENIDGALGAQLDELAWTIGRDTAMESVQAAAVRRLLARSPGTAARLGLPPATGAFDLAGAPGVTGVMDWRLLTPAELKERAAAYLASEESAPALETLDALAEAARDFDWFLLKARALTVARRGGEALDLLAGVAAPAGSQQAALAWARAMAAGDLATALRGRNDLPDAGRRQMRVTSHQYLRQVIDSGSDLALSKSALRLLFTDLAEEGHFDPAVEALRRLRQLDGRDTTGARHLWELGWREYRSHNPSGAVGYWSVLAELYPETYDARRGRYWRARALEALGEGQRADQLYRELIVADDTTDFYRNHANARLARRTDPRQSAAPAAEAGAADRWELPPALERARLLSDLGLDQLALMENDLIAAAARGAAGGELAGIYAGVEQRDIQGLEGMVQARRGERVAAMRLLRSAFPALATSAQSSVPTEIRRLYHPFEYQPTLIKHARLNHLPVHLVAGIVRQESAFNPRATSRAGARGLMQLMPATGRELAGKMRLPWSTERLYEPDFSVLLGTTYFRQVLRRFDGNVELALAGYNGGPNRIDRMWRSAGPGAELDLFLESLALEESRTYVQRVVVLADSYRQLYPPAG